MYAKTTMRQFFCSTTSRTLKASYSSQTTFLTFPTLSSHSSLSSLSYTRPLIQSSSLSSSSSSRFFSSNVNLSKNTHFHSQHRLFSTEQEQVDTATLSETGESLILSESCVNRLKTLMNKRPDICVRIVVDSGGCSGFAYKFGLTDERDDEDIVFEKNGATVLVDPVSLPYVDGSKLDYVEEMIKQSFAIVENPNADSGCGCGASFSATGSDNLFG